MGNFKSKLKKLGKTLRSAKVKAAEGGFGDEVDDGRYKAVLQKCEITESNSDGQLMVGFHFKIKGGDFDGTAVRKYQKFENEDDAAWLGRDLKKFGTELPEEGEEIQEIIDMINEAQPEVKIQAKTKDSGQFLYINSVTDEIDFGDYAEEDPDDEEEEEEEEEEDEDESNDEEEEDENDDESDDEEEDREEDDSEEDDENDEDGVEIGTAVSFTGRKGKLLTGEIYKIVDEETVKVKVGKKNFTVALEDLSLAEEEEEEEPDPKPKKKKKKAKKKKSPKRKVTKKKATKKKKRK